MGRVAAVFVVVALLLVACAEVPLQEERYFRLDASAPMPLARPALAGTLVVKRFAAEGLLGQRALVYADVDAPQALYQYNYHFWTDAPTAMLQQVTATVLRAAGVAQQVVTPAYGAHADHVLSGRIVRLEHLVGASPMVVVNLELAVLDDSRHELELLRAYRLELPVGAPGVAPAVAVMGDALTQILARFIADITHP